MLDMDLWEASGDETEDKASETVLGGHELPAAGVELRPVLVGGDPEVVSEMS